jgi:hypothetical protein
MNAADYDNGSLSARMKRWGTAIAGRLGLAAPARKASAPVSALVQIAGYRSSGGAPAAWRQFALAVQSGLERRLSVEDEIHRLFRPHGTAGDTLVRAVKARVWIAETGEVARLEFDDVHEKLAIALREVLAGYRVNAVPPSDMLQPLHLKLSLGSG